jgi:hypothetical protein
MKFTSKLGTTITIPTGATPKQIAQIKARADSGYGKDAQKIANAIGGTGKTKKPAGGNTPVVTGPGGDPVNVTPAEAKKQSENSISAAESYLNELEGKLSPVDLSGAPKLLSDGDIKAERQSVYDSNYQLQTQGVEDQRAHDLEAQKQELANRGIAYNPGTDPNDPSNVNNVYARSINSVNQRFDTRESNAAAAANAAADSSLSTFVGANKTQNDQYLDTARTKYQTELDQLAGGAGALNVLMTKYGIDEATAQKILDRRSNERIARINNQRTGGSKPSTGGGFGVPSTGGSVS